MARIYWRDIFKHHRLEQFSGDHSFFEAVQIKGITHELEINFHYYALSDKWDINSVCIRGSTNDVWDDLADYECYRIQSAINNMTLNWAKSVGVRLKRDLWPGRYKL